MATSFESGEFAHDFTPQVSDLVGREVYLQAVLAALPRLLSAMDRKPFSRTFGCCDRRYWQLRSIDFPGASHQCMVLTLALLYARPYSPFYRNAKLRLWASAGLSFLASIQERNGSFSHFYPGLNSVAVVAFPSYAASEAFLLLEDELDPALKDDLQAMFQKAGSWLINCRDSEVANQEAGAALALHNISLITGDQRFLIAAQKKVAQIIEAQSPEGWYYEYKGGDIGYSTVGIGYLAKYYLKHQDSVLLESLGKAVEFVSYFVHPNGTMGGEYASRNNEFVIPDGFEILAHSFPQARAVACSIRASLARGTLVTLNAFDSVYCSLNSSAFVQAYEYGNWDKAGHEVPPLPTSEPSQRFFPDSGLCVITTSNYYLVVGGKKGGVLRVYPLSGQDMFADAGFVGRTRSGRLLSSQWQDPERRVEFLPEEHLIRIEGPFYRVNESYMTSSRLIGLRTLMSIAGGSPGFRDWLFKWIRRIAITSSAGEPISFRREVKWGEDYVDIKDSLCGCSRVRLRWLAAAAKFTTMYGQSKEFFQFQELASFDNKPGYLWRQENPPDTLTLSRRVWVRDDQLCIEWNR